MRVHYPDIATSIKTQVYRITLGKLVLAARWQVLKNYIKPVQYGLAFSMSKGVNMFKALAVSLLCIAGCTSNTPVRAVAISESTANFYTTAYSWWDNTPPGSPVISNPVIHKTAGGVGTYADPITLAVGHSKASGKDVLDFPAGTRFYIPNFRRYFIVEDTCGDGAHPETIACHANQDVPGTVQVDMWIDGRSGAASSHAKSNACMDKITDVWKVIKNPATNYKVVASPLYNTACTAMYGNTVVKA